MNFFLVVNEKKDAQLTVTKTVAEYLHSKGGMLYFSTSQSYIAEKTGILSKAVVTSAEECIDNADIAVVIGGDGTILKTAKLLYGKNIPIVGINRGTVGYMAEIEANEYRLLDALFDSPEKVVTDERMMLECRVIRDGNVVFNKVCLNELVVAKGDVVRMIDIDLILGGKTVASYQCDGIIASTPTGSTAYSMSAGGAIIDPKVECVSIIPLCPYLCINAGPIIFSKETEIVLLYRRSRENSAHISADGSEGFSLCDGDRVVITAAEHTTKLLRLKNTDFCRLLNQKLTHRASEIAEKEN